MVIDEAFAALFPDFSSSLAYLAGGADIQPKGPMGKKRPAGSPPLPIGDLGGATARILAGWEKAGSSMPKAVITSPLVADHLIADRLVADHLAGEIPPGRAALPKLLVPFAGKDLIGRGNVSSIEYDYATAYAAMGREAALQIRGAMKKGRADASCGIVFQPDFARREEALAAFKGAFEAGAGAGRLVVRILDPESLAVDPAGATKMAIADMLASGQALLVLAVDDAFAAESAVEGAKNIVLMVDMSVWDDSRPVGMSYGYSIRAREKSLAAAAKNAAARLSGGQAVPEITKVPLRFGSKFLKIF